MCSFRQIPERTTDYLFPSVLCRAAETGAGCPSVHAVCRCSYKLMLTQSHESCRNSPHTLNMTHTHTHTHTRSSRSDYGLPQNQSHHFIFTSKSCFPHKLISSRANLQSGGPGRGERIWGSIRRGGGFPCGDKLTTRK